MSVEVEKSRTQHYVSSGPTFSAQSCGIKTGKNEIVTCLSEGTSRHSCRVVVASTPKNSSTPTASYMAVVSSVCDYNALGLIQIIMSK